LLHTSSIFRARVQVPCLDESFRSHQVTDENKLKQTLTFQKTDQPQADGHINGAFEILLQIVSSCPIKVHIKSKRGKIHRKRCGPANIFTWHAKQLKRPIQNSNSGLHVANFWFLTGAQMADMTTAAPQCQAI